MKLRKDDKVIVMAGRDKGKTGKILAVMPSTNQVVVEGINIAKRATKPNAKYPRGGIIELTKPVPAGKVMVIDPVSGHPARIGYEISKTGEKTRIYKVAAALASKPKPKAAPKTDTKPKTAAKPKATAKSKEEKTS